VLHSGRELHYLFISDDYFQIYITLKLFTSIITLNTNIFTSIITLNTNIFTSIITLNTNIFTSVKVIKNMFTYIYTDKKVYKNAELIKAWNRLKLLIVLGLMK
jgi:hypothetical protein